MTPDQVSGLAGWFKSDAITGLADGDPIGSWTDSSGAGFDVSQTTAAAKPTYHTNVINGLPVVRFDGVDDFLGGTNNLTDRTETVFVVFADANTSITGYTWCEGSSGTSRLGLRAGSGGVFQVRVGGNGIVGHSLTTAWVIHSYTLDAGTSAVAMFYNGTSSGSGTPGTPFSTTVHQIGCDVGQSGTFLSGDIAEIIRYSRVLTATERAQIDSYLSDKYGIPVSDYVSSGTAASASGTISLAGTAAAKAKALAAGALALAGAAAGKAAAAAAGALSLAGTATGKAAAAALGAITTAGTAPARAAASATGSLSMAGTAASGAQEAAAGTGAVEMAGSAAGRAAAAGSATLSLTGAAAATTPLTASGGLTLAGTTTAATTATATGTVLLHGSTALSVTVSATGTLNLVGAGSAANGVASVPGDIAITITPTGKTALSITPTGKAEMTVARTGRVKITIT